MARYKDAIDWIAGNDDTEWVLEDPDSAMGTESVTASMIADLFDKPISVVRSDILKALKRMEKTSP